MLSVDFKFFLRSLKRRLSGQNEQNEPQLLMRYPHQFLPLIEPPEEGYVLRPYRKGDESDWMELLNTNGQLGVWDQNRIRSEIKSSVVEGSQLFVVHGEQIAALASVHDRRVFGVESWEIGWVATHPEHRGKGLGRWVTTASIEVALGLPPRPIVLRTDDYRIPAIKVYLKLGFLPTYDHVSYSHRWRNVFLTLGGDYAGYNPVLEKGVAS